MFLVVMSNGRIVKEPVRLKVPFNLQENRNSDYLHVGFHCTMELIFNVPQFKVFPHLVLFQCPSSH
jgi:hypothetical protein